MNTAIPEITGHGGSACVTDKNTTANINTATPTMRLSTVLERTRGETGTGHQESSKTSPAANSSPVRGKGCIGEVTNGWGLTEAINCSPLRFASPKMEQTPGALAYLRELHSGLSGGASPDHLAHGLYSGPGLE